MPAELIRDNGLAISGLLSRKMGGPPVMPFQPNNIWRSVGRNAPKWKAAQDEDRFRRGIYVVWRRAAPYPSFVNFDAPDRAACLVERPRTNTPLQALTLLNDRSYLEMAISLAKTVSTDAVSVEEQIKTAMKRCVARSPNPNELAILQSLYDSELPIFQTDSKRLKAFFSSASELNLSAQQQTAELAALSVVCNALLNLDETINY